MESGAIWPPTAAAAEAAAAPVQLTAEEEALKRNTDCVYFLASPLTCKKGSECEYRHSEVARVNPRDCYYWLNGNCTNRKCTFRHPPLEGLFGALPTPAAMPPATGYNPTKQSTPCYYFLKGNCIKGDRCPFMHGPPSSGTTAIPQQAAKVSASPIVPPLGTRRKEPLNLSAVAKPAQNPLYNANNTRSTQDNPVPNASKPVNFNGPNGAAPATTKPRAAITVNNAHHLPNKTVPAVNSSDEDLKYPHPLSRGTSVQNHDMSDERPQDSREGDEFLGESSPGFDVIVDHDEEDSGYLPPNEEDFRRAFADSYNPAEMYPLDDYELMPRYESERHGVMSQRDFEPEFDHEADHFGYKGNDQYDRKRRRRDSSSERALDQPIRRRSHREEAGIDAETGIIGSDLRHRLMNKQRKVSGSRSRSDVSPDKRDDGHHRHHHRREERHLEERDRYSSRGMDRADLLDRGAVHGRSRLQGRIKMPVRPAERSDLMHEDVEMEQRRHLRGTARVSPVPVDFSSRRHHDRMSQRSSSREFVGRLGSRRDGFDFSGPKSLAELKGAKSTGKVSEGGVKENAVDFEGPKPLSEILKKKKKVAGIVSGNGSSSENKSHNVGGTPKEDPLTDEVEEGMISEGNGMNCEVQVTSEVDGADEKELEEDQEVEEPYDESRREDSNYYEGEEGEEYQIEDENAYQEEGEANEYPQGEEDFEDDDEQAFARKEQKKQSLPTVRSFPVKRGVFER